MKSSILEFFENLTSLSDLLQNLRNLKQTREKIVITPLPGSLKSLLVQVLINYEDRIVLFLPSVQLVNEMKVELNILGLGDLTLSIDNLDQDNFQVKLTDLSKRQKLIFISTYDIIRMRLPSKARLENSTTQLQVGSEITYDELIEYFNLLNYEREKYVDTAGYFAVRGSIIDFWSYSENRPCRLEFDGDFLESIRHFDPESQRSSDRIDQVTLASSIVEGEEEYYSDIFEYINNPLIIASAFELQNVFKSDDSEIKSEQNFSAHDIDEELKEEIFEETKGLEDGKYYPGKVLERGALNSLNDLLSKDNRWLIEDELGIYEGRIQLDLTDAPMINSNFEMLFNLLKEFSSKGNQVLITVENDLQAARLRDLLSDFNEELSRLIEENKIKITVLAIKSGFIAKKDNFVVLTDYQIFNKPYRTRISQKQIFKKSRVKDFASIKRGDFVVHENFGIGQYAGLDTIKIGQIEQESIKILYAEGGIVYVNLNYLSLIKKFSSKENIKPKLSALGSNEWKSTKKKVKNKIKDAARQLIKLYAQRKASQGIAYSPDTIWQMELEASFFYEDTPDQSKVTEEVKKDMESINPMDRLVCGDVGFGKTEIAVRASFKAVMEGKQVGMLVPTTILAEQHYNTFKDRLAQFPVKVEALSRFQTKARQTEIIKEIECGKVDLVIGTHRLLSKDVKFNDLGLLIIDEEHRFGVMAKEKLRSMKTNLDTLTLTATPIPRTLNLSLLGARDLSLIATPPPNRQPIYTKVETFDILKIREWVMEETKRDGQIYFVHDRVQSIDKIAGYLQKHIPNIKIAVAHGQLRPAQLEKVIYDFLNRKFHMLVSTKIIESGLDIPNVNTIIINRADRFGLAELHQLRGRVGRSDRQAYAYLLVPSLNSITKKAVKRLQAIEEYTDLGEGFNISMRDLEIRGAGNLLGTEQSGVIDTVGFDMYVKLLDEAVEELKQSEFNEEFKDLPKQLDRSETTIDTYFEIGIPKGFMPDQADRLGFYTALFSLVKIEEIDEIREEMEDRFGKLPVIIERLILTAILRFYASFALFGRIIVKRNKVVLLLPKEGRGEYYENKFSKLMHFIMQNYSKEMEFKQVKDSLKLELDNKFSSPEAVLKYLIEFSKSVFDIINREKCEL